MSRFYPINGKGQLLDPYHFRDQQIAAPLKRCSVQNAGNDAKAVAARLRELNYDVALATDAGRRAMGQAIDQFIAKLGTADVALFYYSGHGMQVDGENYLIPTDFQGKDETDVRYDAYPAGRIQERMERSGAQLNILVLDACRDNPFRAAVRSGVQGLATPAPGMGTFIALATAPGRTASDNPRRRNGLFTSYLLEALSTPGLGLNDLFDYVRQRVVADSAGKQVPWVLSSVSLTIDQFDASFSCLPKPDSEKCSWLRVRPKGADQ